MTIRRITLDASSWTAIVAPVACNRVTLAESTGLVGIVLRSDPADSTTEKAVATTEMPYGFGQAPVGSGRSVYQVAQTVVYAQSASGTITAVATFV